MLGTQPPTPAVVDPRPPLLPARVLAAHAAVGLALGLVVPLPVGDARLPVMCVALLLHVLDDVLLSRYRP